MAKKQLKFEEALARIEKIVEELEAGTLSLDDSLSRYEEGVKALQKCYAMLRDAEKKVEILLKGEDGSMKTAPFEQESESASTEKSKDAGKR